MPYGELIEQIVHGQGNETEQSRQSHSQPVYPCAWLPHAGGYGNSYQTVPLYKMALSRKKVVRQGKGDSEEQGGGGGYVGKGCCQKAWLPYFMWLR